MRKTLIYIESIILAAILLSLYELNYSVSYNEDSAVLNRVGMLNNRVELSEVDQKIKRLEAASPIIEKLNSLERKLKAHINRHEIKVGAF